MSHINQQILDLIDNTLAWASDMSEQWTGTPYEKVIDGQQAQLIMAVGDNDLNRAHELVHSLARTLEQAERALNEDGE
jgi:hypothetical protein